MEIASMVFDGASPHRQAAIGFLLSGAVRRIDHLLRLLLCAADDRRRNRNRFSASRVGAYRDHASSFEDEHGDEGISDSLAQGQQPMIVQYQIILAAEVGDEPDFSLSFNAASS
jgi:hypothetical protein